MKENMTKNVKEVAGLIASAGVATFCGYVVQAVLPDNIKLIAKISAMVGGTVVGAMVQEKAIEFMERKVDKIMENVEVVSEEEAEPEAVEA